MRFSELIIFITDFYQNLCKILSRFDLITVHIRQYGSVRFCLAFDKEYVETNKNQNN